MSTLISSVTAMAQLLTQVAGGCYLGYKKVLTNEGPVSSINGFSKVVLHLFLPALLMSRVMNSVRSNPISELVIFPIFAFIHICLGGCIGFLSGKLIKVPCPRIFGAASAFGNCGYVPLSLVAALASTKAFSDDENFEGDASAYIATYLICFSFLYWSVGYSIVTGKPDAPATESAVGSIVDSGDEMQDVVDDDGITIELVDDEPPVEDAADDTPNSAEFGTDPVDEDVSDFNEPPKLTVIQMLLKGLTPPSIAVICGLVVGLISPVSEFLLPDDATEWQAFLMQALTKLGSAAVPCALAVMGANLYNLDWRRAPLGVIHLVALMVNRFVLLPLAGFGMYELASTLGLLDSMSKAGKLVLLLETALPPGTNLIIMTATAGHGQEEMAQMLFWSMIVSVVGITGWTAFWLTII